jgi:hypothetical protein
MEKEPRELDNSWNSSSHLDDSYQDSVLDALDRLQEDGGIAPEVMHRKPIHSVRFPKSDS